MFPAKDSENSSSTKENETPSITPDELNRLMGKGTDLVVLDSRPLDEYVRMSIPTAMARNSCCASMTLHRRRIP